MQLHWSFCLPLRSWSERKSGSWEHPGESNWLFHLQAQGGELTLWNLCANHWSVRCTNVLSGAAAKLWNCSITKNLLYFPQLNSVSTSQIDCSNRWSKYTKLVQIFLTITWNLTKFILDMLANCTSMSCRNCWVLMIFHTKHCLHVKNYDRCRTLLLRFLWDSQPAVAANFFSGQIDPHISSH